MSRHKNESKFLSFDTCYQYLDEIVFKLKDPDAPSQVGLEAEMFPYFSSSKDDERPRLVPLKSSGSLSHALHSIVGRESSWQAKYSDGANIPAADLLQSVTVDGADFLTFEPGGQIEISTRPFDDLTGAVDRLYQLRQRLSSQLEQEGIELLSLGLFPWLTPEQIGLQMNKPRYVAMDAFFSKKGPMGRMMMRQTATVQVNLDYGATEDVLAKRYLAANLLAPIATAIFAYSPFSEGVPNGSYSFRSRVWQGLDDSRTGFPDLKQIAVHLDKKSCVDAYAQRLMDLELAFGVNYVPIQEGITFGDWVKNSPKSQPYESPTQSDLLTHLSLFFPEVRARGFLELRSVDMQSDSWLSVPASFYVSLLYDDANLSRVLELLEPYMTSLHDLWLSSSRGLQDPQIANLTRKLMALALDGIKNLAHSKEGDSVRFCEKRLLAFAQHFTERSRTPADDFLDTLATIDEKKLTFKHLLLLEDSWRRLLH